MGTGEDREMTPVSGLTPTAQTFPVSVKGVLVRDGRVLLLKNERDEWELPGGKLELGEAPPDCVAREITEETGLAVTTGPVLDAWQYHIREGHDVLIITYGCHPEGTQSPSLSTEHQEMGFFTLAEAANLTMPAGYKHSIQSWFAHLADANNEGA
jgi:ADP-ribose pyrophosphatase YjhB (NUDIX family)